MKTEYIDLSDSWTAVTDGVQVFDVKVEIGSAIFCLSETLPADKSDGHTVNAGQWFKFNGGVKAWFRTALNGSAITVSSYTIE